MKPKYRYELRFYNLAGVVSEKVTIFAVNDKGAAGAAGRYWNEKSGRLFKFAVLFKLSGKHINEVVRAWP